MVRMRFFSDDLEEVRELRRYLRRGDVGGNEMRSGHRWLRRSPREVRRW